MAQLRDVFFSLRRAIPDHFMPTSPVQYRPFREYRRFLFGFSYVKTGPTLKSSPAVVVISSTVTPSFRRLFIFKASQTMGSTFRLEDSERLLVVAAFEGVLLNLILYLIRAELYSYTKRKDSTVVADGSTVQYQRYLLPWPANALCHRR